MATTALLLALAAATATQSPDSTRTQAAGVPLASAAMPAGTRGAAPAGPNRHLALRSDGPIALDGVLGEAIWQRADSISDFTQKDPTEGAPASQRTVVRLVYDADAVYVGAELYDTAPDSIVAKLARRDRFMSSDRFFVFLDPFHDRRTGAYFGVNAAGTQYDGILYNDDWDDDTWDGVWDAAVKRTERGWSVEMRIPYSQLRFERRAEHVWGVNFRRDIARSNESAWVVYTPKSGSGFVSRFRELGGITGVTPPRRLEVLPYVTAKAEFLDHTPGDPFNDGSRLRQSVGADVKFGLGSNLTVDATVNPDFGQVEVDPAVVNLSDVESFFEEKRPFFIEGANIFGNFGSGGANNNWGFNNPTPDLLYTRRIGRAPQLGAGAPEGAFVNAPDGTHILGAGKLTGKVGDWSLGTLSAFTQREHATIDDGGVRSRAEIEPFTYYNATRMLKEFSGGRRGLGIIATGVVRDIGPVSQDALNASAFTVGVDGWTRLGKNETWALTGRVSASRVSGTEARMRELQENSIHYFQRPDADHVEVDPNATSLSGYSGRIALNKQKGRFYSNTAFGFVSPGFETNDLGFQWTSDAINAHQVLGYRWNRPTSWYRGINWNASIVRSWDFGGNMVHSMYWTNYNMTLKNFYRVYAGGNYNPERINNRRTRGGPLTISPSGFSAFTGFNSDDRRSIVFSAEGNIARYGQDSERSFGLFTSVEWKPMDRLSVSVSPQYRRFQTAAQYVTAVDDAAATETFGTRYVFADLDQTTVSASVRANWIFTPKLSFELYAQPLVSSGDYGAPKSLVRPRSYEFEPYAGDVGNQDFTFASLRGNAVLRWEYLQGSTVYLVWTQGRSASEDVGDFRFGRSFDQLVSAKADNIFLVKLSYWWNP